MIFYFFGLLFVVSYLFVVFLFFYLWSVGGVVFDFFMFSFGDIFFSFCFIIDCVSLCFFSCISFISFVVFFMGFFMFPVIMTRVGLVGWFFFVGSMFVLVFSGNFFTVLFGWDGLGLVSFCLVVYYNNFTSSESGLLTFFTNRIGDSFFLISFFFWYFRFMFLWFFFFFL